MFDEEIKVSTYQTLASKAKLCFSNKSEMFLFLINDCIIFGLI